MLMVYLFTDQNRVHNVQGDKSLPSHSWDFFPARQMGLIKPIFVLIFCNGAKEQELISPPAANLDMITSHHL